MSMGLNGPYGNSGHSGQVVGAALVSHVPTIVLPHETRLQLNAGREISLVPGLHRLRAEVMDSLAIDTVVVFDAHWASTVEFIVTAHDHRSGKYTSEELPRGMSQVPYSFAGDPRLASLFAAEAEQRDDMWVTAIDDPHLPIHYPTTNLLPFLQRDGERWISVSICQTGSRDDFLLAGQLLGEAIRKSGRRVMLLASGAMSHTFWPLQELRKHEASDAEHIFTPEAFAFDQQILQWWAAGDHASVIESYSDYRQYKPEARFGHYLMMVGALGGSEFSGVGTPYSEYENAIGTGQIHVNFAV
jgi:3,4-dihydroxyphenylacetate 2,3-dioxygenase